jgi:hypothetical protein
MAETSPHSADPGASGLPPPDAPELVPGRGRLREYALHRLRESRVLQVCAVASFLCYGAIPYLIYARREALSGGLTMPQAFVLLLMSLGSWSFLFWWYPVFERTLKVIGEGRRARTLAGVLEGLAIACVAVVHALMALIIVWQGASAP